MAKYTEIAEEIMKYDIENFGVILSKGEVAHLIWSNHMTPADRLEIMNQCGDFKSALQKLRACLRIISDQI